MRIISIVKFHYTYSATAPPKKLNIRNELFTLLTSYFCRERGVLTAIDSKLMLPSYWPKITADLDALSQLMRFFVFAIKAMSHFVPADRAKWILITGVYRYGTWEE